MRVQRQAAGCERGAPERGGGAAPSRAESNAGSHGAGSDRGRTASLLAFFVFVAAGLALYYPCLRGPFISDDQFAVFNPYTAKLNARSVLELFAPFGAPAAMLSEYRPLWLLLHGVERQVFGDSVLGYHVTNVVLHGVVSALLAILFARSGLPTAWAMLGGMLFLVHPANVEAVAWISQITSCAALGLALGALLLAPRRPAAALLCFTLGLLAKPLASFALPVAALFAWVNGDGARGRARWAWLGGWLAVFAVYSAIELTASRSANFGVEPMHPDTLVVARTIVANAFRYLVMAASGYGLAAFHQARPALSWLDPWWLGGAVGLGLLAWRTAYALARRRQEGVYWAWAAVAFAPVSQVVPFTHPVADRYLYFVLPGLLGAALLAAHAAVLRWQPASRRATALRFAGVLAVVLAVALAAEARQRAGLWVSFDRLAEDSMRHYPDGMWAHLLRSQRAGREGDAAQSAAELRAAFERGYRDYGPVVGDPAWGRVLRDPRFQQVLVEMAQWWVASIGQIDRPNQVQLYKLASAYFLLGDMSEVRDALERALAAGGSLDESIRAQLARLPAQARK